MREWSGVVSSFPARGGVVLPCFANLWLASFRSGEGGKTRLAASGVNQTVPRSTLSSLPRTDSNRRPSD